MLLMNRVYFTAPLQGARLILAWYPGLPLRLAQGCPGLLSFGPSGALLGTGCSLKTELATQVKMLMMG